jgi:formate hydrogenlyase subunit 6/NADH:ubiquinone oxidoreductase subunit I
MFCQECIEACPTNALNSKPDFETACLTKDGALLNWKGIEQKKEASSADAAEKDASEKNEGGKED